MAFFNWLPFVFLSSVFSTGSAFPLFGYEIDYSAMDIFLWFFLGLVSLTACIGLYFCVCQPTKVRYLDRYGHCVNCNLAGKVEIRDGRLISGHVTDADEESADEGLNLPRGRGRQRGARGRGWRGRGRGRGRQRNVEAGYGQDEDYYETCLPENEPYGY